MHRTVPYSHVCGPKVNSAEESENPALEERTSGDVWKVFCLDEDLCLSCPLTSMSRGAPVTSSFLLRLVDLALLTTQQTGKNMPEEDDLQPERPGSYQGIFGIYSYAQRH